MRPSDRDFGERFIARTGIGEERGRGKLVAYSEGPMMHLEMDDGQKLWWNASLCEPVPRCPECGHERSESESEAK